MSEMPQPFWLWLDLEMTGLDVATDRILEAAVIVTDREFVPCESYSTAVYQSAEVLAGMNEWCQRQHTASGLVERVPEGIKETELDTKLAGLVDARWNGIPAILCGNSIHQDRKFVDRYLPELARRLHYRMLDVSSFKVVFSECFDVRFQKSGKHLALDDIQESIAELRHYFSYLRDDLKPA